MSKKGPLGKAELFYIEEKYKSGKDVEEIANDLDRSIICVKKHIDTLQITRSKTIIGEQFIHQKGATIMTENASTMIDTSKNKYITNPSSCTTKMKHE